MITPFLPAAPADVTWYDIVESPVGRLVLTADSRGSLSGLYLLDAGDRSASVRPEWTPVDQRAATDGAAGGGASDDGAEGAAASAVFAAAEAQLAEYFAGTRTVFDLPLAPRGTEFQREVWGVLAEIPFGKTMSYGEVAAALGKSLLASRAVGLANGRNPISIILPCHRVIGADGSMTGYGWGVQRKEWLLRHEGVLDVPADDTGRSGRLF